MLPTMLPTKFLLIGSATILMMAVTNLLGQVPGQRFPAPSPPGAATMPTDKETITAPNHLAQSRAPNFSALEQAIIQETNAARTNPREYAAKLEKLTQYFQGDILKIPGQTPLRTQEGVSAVNEAIQFLKSARPLEALTVSRGMSQAAADHVRDQGPGGLLGHTGTDGSQPWERLERYGQWQQIVGENISYGPNTGADVVISLIVDDGVASRGHRQNIFNPAFRVTGVACGEHREYRVICVITYAGGYVEK